MDNIYRWLNKGRHMSGCTKKQKYDFIHKFVRIIKTIYDFYGNDRPSDVGYFACHFSSSLESFAFEEEMPIMKFIRVIPPKMPPCDTNNEFLICVTITTNELWIKFKWDQASCMHGVSSMPEILHGRKKTSAEDIVEWMFVRGYDDQLTRTMTRSIIRELVGCSMCGVTSTTRLRDGGHCGGCTLDWYCSKTCQIQHRKEHKEKCACRRLMLWGVLAYNKSLQIDIHIF